MKRKISVSRTLAVFAMVLGAFTLNACARISDDAEGHVLFENNNAISLMVVDETQKPIGTLSITKNSPQSLGDYLGTGRNNKVEMQIVGMYSLRIPSENINLQDCFFEGNSTTFSDSLTIADKRHDVLITINWTDKKSFCGGVCCLLPNAYGGINDSFRESPLFYQILDDRF